MTSKKNIKLPTETLEQISQINWENKEFLEKLGFYDEGQESGQKYYNEKYGISVTYTNEKPENLSNYKNLQYEFSESTLGALDFQRIYVRNIPWTRTFRIYVGNAEILSFKHYYAYWECDFEDAINEIYQFAKNKT